MAVVKKAISGETQIARLAQTKFGPEPLKVSKPQLKLVVK
jgi:hypothetical protein